ncbi:cytochrome b/b6 domain-containing protein [Orrella daihaiensis]|uniref:Cytochrome b/b6 domain-containing protein n=1 Tax=Orrella daihaiensis TaxID=2782176 RepID=A0ABY4AFZ4_9BURK|nr:cytochrome b/b6 domain-containing protein [Orrella daihaiensis]UOD49217.1 cytochrome b/b6 domain-containing protein [Orrella daihaiensis]
MKHNPQRPTIRIWDLPTRLFHWLFAASVIGAVATVKVGGSWMDWHLPLGITALVLLVFRLVWGFTGSRYARFSSFVRSPGATVTYLRKQHRVVAPGHNPLGAWSVLALLTVVGIQAFTGLFTTDEILTQGPLNQFVSSDVASLMSSIHRFNEKPLFLLVGLHLIAILIYALRGTRLVPPMITGDKPADQLPPDTPAARDDVGIRAWGLVLIVILGSIGWWLIELGNSAGMSFN